MDASFPAVLSVLRAAIPLSFVLILRLCGATPVPELFAFWRSPLRLLDDVHALVCRSESCESPECELAAGTGLLEFSCWPALEPSLAVHGSTCHMLTCVRVWSVVFVLRVDF